MKPLAQTLGVEAVPGVVRFGICDSPRLWVRSLPFPSSIYLLVRASLCWKGRGASVFDKAQKFCARAIGRRGIRCLRVAWSETLPELSRAVQASAEGDFDYMRTHCRCHFFDMRSLCF